MDTPDKTYRKYDFAQIDRKWQERWDRDQLFKAPKHPDPANKFYMLVMFAYPSGDIHMGHFRNYIIGDAIARRQMMLGKQVLHPFGWDAFGLPAERAAIQRGVHPEDWTLKNVEVSRDTLKKVGISFDWSREVNSSAPDYYKWTQWMFIQLFKKGLAYRQRGFVNWCPEDKTVLANEQVKDGCCERCGTLVEKKDQVQWYFKITAYADRLIDDLDTLPGWPDNVKTMQKEWIGRSHGLEIDFVISDTGEKIPVFTTRPDTVYGVTFMAIAPEAEILGRFEMSPECAQKVAEYKSIAIRRSDIERVAVTGDKDGVFTGQYAVNPFSGERVQLWVADYVLAGYGTGVVMGVPAHDTRDFAFAKKYDIPIKVVIEPDAQTSTDAKTMTEAFVEYGPMVNSGQFNGKSGEPALLAVGEYAEQQQIGRRKVNYKLKDWSISRQRYWGCPIPIVHCPVCGPQPVSDNDLPVVLPHVDNYLPKGRSPLADVPEYVNTTCPKCGGKAERDSDTMDTFVCSSWYFLRYCDAQNIQVPFDKSDTNSWMPVDLYIGGITHATGHLIYFRFFQKFLKDIGWLTHDEPALRLFNHGMVSDSKGEVMSKSKGNVVSPIALMAERGTDIARLAMYFTAPSEKEVLWSNDGITGVEKFVLNRLMPLVREYRRTKPDLKRYFKQSELSADEQSIYIKLNQTIRRVDESFERLQFNTAISALMELLRDYDPAQIKNDALNDCIVFKSIQMVAPLTPHVAEELWEQAGQVVSVFKSHWPQYDPDAVQSDSIAVAVQVNGKLRDTVTVAVESLQDEVEAAAFASSKVQAHIQGKEVIKKVYVPGRLLSIVVKG